jgi:hypothetical protein
MDLFSKEITPHKRAQKALFYYPRHNDKVVLDAKQIVSIGKVSD